jgi:hypothetical protein
MRIEEKGIFKVEPDATRLEYWTSLGWRLVAVLESQAAVPFQDTENFPNPLGGLVNQPTGGLQNYGMGTAPVYTAYSTRHHPMRAYSFLLVLEEDSAIAQMKAEVAQRDEKIRLLGEVEKQVGEARTFATSLEERLKNLEVAHARTLGELTAANKAHADYKAEVAEKMKAAADIIEKDKDRKRTAYERLVEGGYDDSVEGVEERDERG